MAKRPQSTAVVATSLATGEQHLYKSMIEAAEKGGFSYQYVQKCVRGQQRQHAGFTFIAVSPKRPNSTKLNRTEEAGVLRGMGMGLAAIANALKVKPETASKYIQQAARLGLCQNLKEAKQCQQ
ncbi:MAG: hypothetical protein ACRCUF_08535 [Aeromonas sobria]